MKINTSIIGCTLVIGLLLIIFRNWLMPGILSSGDWVYYYPSSISEITPFSVWDSRHLGLGASKLPTMWLESYFTLSVKTALFVGWQLFERIFWFFPFIVFGFLSSYLLARKIVGNTFFSIIAPLVYVSNTYSILLVGGGQMGVALAYSFAPFVVLQFHQIIFLKNVTLRRSLIAGFAFAALTMLDIRLAYIVAGAIGIMVFFLAISKRSFNIFSKRQFIYLSIIPLLVTICLHFYWLLPIILFKTNPINLLGEEYTGAESVKFFSFAKLENAFSLLHPNWPENIFGKVYFLKPQYLLIPLIAFSSLLFTTSYKKRLEILLFVLISLIGIFLAKGANEPFGELYLWLFNNIPGFKMFRDPTKWYLLIAIGFSVLIPFALERLSASIKYLKNKSVIVFLAFLMIWILLIHNVIFFNKGTFTQHTIPAEYQAFAGMVGKDSGFYRTLWIPIPHRFAYHSSVHPAVLLREVAGKKTPEGFFKEKNAEKILYERGIRYVVVPIDTNAEFFLLDRSYSEKVRQKIIDNLSSVSFLERVRRFENLAVFELRNYREQFFSIPFERRIYSKRVSPTHYKINIDGGASGRLIFSENFDKNWAMKSDEKTYNSTQYNGLNSFPIEEKRFEAEIVYSPQQYVWYGLIVSVATLIVLVIMIFSKR